ncbi:transcriptional regulator ChbR [Kosakonia cowanii JCM 10956 = DSM 18146]|uniref:Transcriptional regulator ChbR n=1 Tax=Kosakonia cowanii JCM 10956 = DSM 18146 TaxID=1300165 RepID=A0A807LD47_9ENTR|nr:transcriptional regulator ChbR [Kosakonia cowanii]APZ04526.1 transcriptional regulator ChbR [Kosakonia cowanii JCM 10956 = DSM 18146]
MQPTPMIGTQEIKTVHEQQLFKGKPFHVFIFNKSESASGLHQHDYYEFTLVLTGRYYQIINGKRVLLERGDFVFIPLGSHHQSVYEYGAARILNVGISRKFFEQYYQSLMPFCFVASQPYRTHSAFLTYVETVIASLNFRENGLDEFIETVTFYVLNRLRHYREEQVLEDIPQWLRSTVEAMHDKRQFSDNALENMVRLSCKSQEYLTRATRRFYDKTPMQIINEIRIDFAKKQLEMTNYLVADIAWESGYSSPSLFIKTFKKMTSFTPNSYRKRLTEITQ